MGFRKVCPSLQNMQWYCLYEGSLNYQIPDPLAYLYGNRILGVVGVSTLLPNWKRICQRLDMEPSECTYVLTTLNCCQLKFSMSLWIFTSTFVNQLYCTVCLNQRRKIPPTEDNHTHWRERKTNMGIKEKEQPCTYADQQHWYSIFPKFSSHCNLGTAWKQNKAYISFAINISQTSFFLIMASP